MQCTAEEIQEKRRQALLKLKAKNSPNKSLDLSGMSSGISPKRMYNFKPYDKPKPSMPFHNGTTNNNIKGTCYLISDKRFAVDLLGFSAQAISIFKTIPSRNYNAQTKIWDFHVNDHELLQRKLVSLQPDVVVGKLPSFVLNAIKTPPQDYSNIDLSKIDEQLLTSLMPFQVEGVCFGIEKKGRCLIADEMGLGKTFQALAIASYYKDDWPLLIVTTASMKTTWEDTIHQYLPSVSILDTQYMTSGKDYIGESKILIVSHDMMTRAEEKLKGRNFGVIIIDESHTFKNFKAKCTKVATNLSGRCKRLVLLSGTPALSRPSELFTQLNMLDPKFFGSFFEYSKRYCDAKQTSFGWDSNGTSNLQELNVILERRFMIRRTKDGVLKSLPDKTQEIVSLDVKLSSFSKEERDCLNLLAEKYSSIKGVEKHAALLPFFSETSKIKIPSVCSYIMQTLETSNKFIVFAHHQKMLDAVESVLARSGKKYIRIDGNTTTDQRKHHINKFQYDDKFVCAILSITAANAGITLTSAQLIIFAELHWNPSILSQAESRAHRIGQQGKVTVKYLLAGGTADDAIWPLLKQKQKILGEIGLTKDSYENISSVQKQNTIKLDKILDYATTSERTLDISNYFLKERGREADASFEDEMFNDGFDDALSSIDI